MENRELKASTTRSSCDTFTTNTCKTCLETFSAKNCATCTICTKSFCLGHFGQHACDSKENSQFKKMRYFDRNARNTNISSSMKRQICRVSGCNQKIPSLRMCGQCRNSFCDMHKSSKNHNCIPIISKSRSLAILTPVSEEKNFVTKITIAKEQNQPKYLCLRNYKLILRGIILIGICLLVYVLVVIYRN